MKNHLYFQRFRTAAAELTTEQIEALTDAQVAERVEVAPTVLTPAFIANMKRLLVAERQQVRDVAVKDAVLGQLIGNQRTWLERTHPDYAVSVRREGGKVCVELWPEGMPEEVLTDDS